MEIILHSLLILSKNAYEYQRLIKEEQLLGLSILAATSKPEDMSQLRSYDILLGDPSLIKEVLQEMPALSWVQTTWAGVEPLLKPGLRRDYDLTNARGVFGPLMSEYVFGYLLFHERRILQRYKAQQKQLWDGSITGTLRGKSLGLLGVGSIGAHLAATAKHFGMQVRGYTCTSQSCQEVDRYYHGDDLRIFISGLDYLVNSLPGTSKTRHLVDATVLNWLPKHAIFINIGRGSTTDERALMDALIRKQLSGAVLDVFEQEPLPEDHFFWNTPNIIITSHTAAPTIAIDLVGLFLENYERYCNHKPLKYLVDFERGY
jgi:phosphoglycerate dehydrogenase-like enzyme